MKDEETLDKVTAISGSVCRFFFILANLIQGPAYFFAFIEALRAAGIKLGLSSEDANTMAITTAYGAYEITPLYSI